MATTDIIIAGGGGGNAGSRFGGDGGGLTGASASVATGGTQSAGGSGHTVDCTSGDGSLGQGGNGCWSGSFGGAGGGGGYYGGGGGSSDGNNAYGAGGGSSFTHADLTNVTHTQGENLGDGEVLIYDSSDNLLQSFSYLGSEEEWTVPSGHASVKITARGAESGETGWGSSGARGKGGKVDATVDVVKGQKIYIKVGQSGNNHVGGYGGGGDGADNGTYPGGGGGGATFVSLGDAPTSGGTARRQLLMSM